jgi:hypothetical protein
MVPGILAGTFYRHGNRSHRSRGDPEGLAAAYNFQRIPTIMVFQGGAEIGRIVESPEVSLEHDLLTILQGSTNAAASSASS